MGDSIIRDILYQEYPPLGMTDGMLTEPEVPVALATAGWAGSPIRPIIGAVDGTPTSWRLELPPSGPPQLGLSWIWAKTKQNSPIQQVLRAAGLRRSIEDEHLRDAHSHGIRIDLELGDKNELRSVSRFYPAWFSCEGVRRYQQTSTGWILHEVTSPFMTNPRVHINSIRAAHTTSFGNPMATDTLEFALTLSVSAAVGFGNDSFVLYGIGFDIGETRQLLKQVPSASSLREALDRIAGQVIHRTFDVELRFNTRMPEAGLSAAVWGVL